MVRHHQQMKGKEHQMVKFEPNVRAVIYARVSTKDQAQYGEGIPAQLHLIREYAARNNITIVKEVIDGGESVKLNLGPNFIKMLKENDPTIDRILIFSLDRVTRNPSDVQEIINLLNETDYELESITEHIMADDPEDRDTNLHLYGFLAYMDNRNRAKHIRKGKKHKATNGGMNGSVATGYTSLSIFKEELKDLEEHGEISSENREDYLQQAQNIMKQYNLDEKTIFPDPRIKFGVIKAFELYARGKWSPQRIARYLNQNRYPVPLRNKNSYWTRRTIDGILNNSVYIGKTNYKKDFYDGNHPALISKEIWNQCQIVREKRKAGPRKKANPRQNRFPLAKIAFCPRCGGHMNVDTNNYRARYYRDAAGKHGNCTNRKLVRALPAEQYLIELISNINLSQDWRERILAKADINRDAKEIEKERQRLIKRLDTIVTLFDYGHRTKSEFLGEREQILSEIDSLEPVVEYDLEEAANLLDNFGALLEDAKLPEIGEIFHVFFNKVYLDQEHESTSYVVAIQPNPAFFQLMNLGEIPEKIIVIDPQDIPSFPLKSNKQ